MDVNNEYGCLAIQKSCVSLLREFNEFAKQNNINYSLAYGTLLGAIRHKGFIPWDDDIDIIVDRDNYNALLNAIRFSDSIRIERISLDCLWTDRIKFKQINKENEHATIDIFLFDNSPNGKLAHKLKLYTIYCLQGMMKYNLSLKKGSILMKCCALITYILGKPFSHKTKYRWYNSLSQVGNEYDTQYIECYNTIFEYIHVRFPKKVFDHFEMRQFEDLILPAMAEYDLFLKTQYGDYMTPPVDKSPKHYIKNQS